MPDQKNIITSLHKNKCLSCGRSHTYASQKRITYTDGTTHHIYYVGCAFCSTCYEITKETWENNVRIKDTQTYKQRLGESKNDN